MLKLGVLLYNKQVLADMKLQQYRASERVTDADQEELSQNQLEFMSTPEESHSQTGKKTRKVRARCPWSVKGQRNAAHLHIKALDHQLRIATGVGLLVFKCCPDEAVNVA